MNCKHAENLIAEAIAGELREADRPALEEHLRDCEACRQLEKEWRADDLHLQAGFAAWRGASETVAARTIRQLHREQLVVPPKRTLSAWIPFIVGLAAGVLLMLTLWRPWNLGPELKVADSETTSPAIPESPVAARPVLASVVGDVEVQPAANEPWALAKAGSEIPIGATIRTQADSLCEFVCPSGETARLSVDSQLRVPKVNEVELVKGQVWTGVPHDGEMCVRTGAGSVLTKGGAVNVACSTEETVVTAASGSALVKLINNEEHLVAGEELAIVGDRVTRRDRAYNLALITAWMNPLLALKSPDDPELNAHVDALLSHLGETKMTLLSDAELRSLGPSCTVPLSRFVRTASPTEQQEARRHAARLLADLAPLSLAGDMVELLADQDGEVRASAAACLKRLTGQDMGFPPDQWNSEPDDAQRAALQHWQSWWVANSFRCAPISKPTRASEEKFL